MRSKRLLPILLSFNLFFSFLPSVSAEIHGTQDFTGTYYHVDGNKSRSFYPGNRGTNDGLVDKEEKPWLKKLF